MVDWAIEGRSYRASDPPDGRAGVDEEAHVVLLVKALDAPFAVNNQVGPELRAQVDAEVERHV